MRLSANPMALRGGAILELALIIPIIILLFCGCIDYALLFYVQNRMDNAALDASIAAARHGGTAQQGIDKAKKELSDFSADFKITVKVPDPDNKNDHDVTVHISVPRNAVSFNILGQSSSGTLESEVTMRKEE